MYEGAPVHSELVWIELFIAEAARDLCTRSGFAIFCFHDLLSAGAKTGIGIGVRGMLGKRDRARGRGRARARGRATGRARARARGRGRYTMSRYMQRGRGFGWLIQVRVICLEASRRQAPLSQCATCYRAVWHNNCDISHVPRMR
jgi:hypothetical protein